MQLYRYNNVFMPCLLELRFRLDNSEVPPQTHLIATYANKTGANKEFSEMV